MDKEVKITLRMFVLVRAEDVSGTSGTGIVAEGAQFSNGKCAISWRTYHTSVAIYNSIEDVMAIHGHDGRTTIKWL